jgi:beta-hydroxylase
METYINVAIIIVFIIILVAFRGKRCNSYYRTSKIYPELIELEENDRFNAIVQEMKNVNSSTWINWPEEDLWKETNENKWTVFPLYGFGKWSKNTSRCPSTTSFLKGLGPNLQTAGFSLLEPGVELTKHRGWADLSNNVLRSHLLLTEHPENTCQLWVNGQTHSHQYQKWITFDDSLIHSAKNSDNEDRVVLLIDMVRPNHISKGTSTVPHSSELDRFVAAM